MSNTLDDENRELLRFRREWIEGDRYEHSCLQGKILLLSGREACGICGAVFDLGDARV